MVLLVLVIPIKLLIIFFLCIFYFFVLIYFFDSLFPPPTNTNNTTTTAFKPIPIPIPLITLIRIMVWISTYLILFLHLHLLNVHNVPFHVTSSGTVTPPPLPPDLGKCYHWLQSSIGYIYDDTLPFPNASLLLFLVVSFPHLQLNYTRIEMSWIGSIGLTQSLTRVCKRGNMARTGFLLKTDIRRDPIFVSTWLLPQL